VFEGDELVHADYYTVIDGDAFEYVNAPQVLSETGVMDFSSEYFQMLTFLIITKMSATFSTN